MDLKKLLDAEKITSPSLCYITKIDSLDDNYLLRDIARAYKSIELDDDIDLGPACTLFHSIILQRRIYFVLSRRDFFKMYKRNFNIKECYRKIGVLRYKALIAKWCNMGVITLIKLGVGSAGSVYKVTQSEILLWLTEQGVDGKSQLETILERYSVLSKKLPVSKIKTKA